jgi:hypothetical protein
MNISRETVVRALEATLLLDNPSLLAYSDAPGLEHHKAIEDVNNCLGQFRQIVLNELENWSLTNRYCRSIVEARLNQENPLSSKLVHMLFPTGPRGLEKRIARTHHVPNFSTILSEVAIPSEPSRGPETDEAFLDVWTEILILDILIHGLHFQNVQKVVRGKAEPCVEFLAVQKGRTVAVEVSRIRERDFEGGTLPNAIQDCYKPENLRVIRRTVFQKLRKKDDQLRRFSESELQPPDKSIVALKTSQWEYQDCNQAIAGIAKRLLHERSFPHIGQLLVVYDVENFDMIQNPSTQS